MLGAILAEMQAMGDAIIEARIKRFDRRHRLSTSIRIEYKVSYPTSYSLTTFGIGEARGTYGELPELVKRAFDQAVRDTHSSPLHRQGLISQKCYKLYICIEGECDESFICE
jgi:hypothetical protein